MPTIKADVGVDWQPRKGYVCK